MESDRIYALTSRLFEYVKSPSLKHIRDPHSIQRLAHELLTAVDRASSIWTKWEGPREDIAKAAAHCWISIEDLQAYLNQLPGPALTRTDVTQRLRAIYDETYGHYPNEDVKASCLALYEAEKAQGTEMPAIIGALQEHIEVEEDRLSRKRDEAYRRHQAEERVRAQQRFMAGADCGWTKLDGSEGFYCRRNGRTFRTVQDKDKRWSLFRVTAPEDKGALLGTYQGRRDANKALEKNRLRARAAMVIRQRERQGYSSEPLRKQCRLPFWASSVHIDGLRSDWVAKW